VRTFVALLITALLFTCKGKEGMAPEWPASPPCTPRRSAGVRSADLHIVVADTSKSVEAVAKSVEAAGGYVADSRMWRDGNRLRARLTLRVPGDKLTSTLAAIRRQAKRVDNETIHRAEAPTSCPSPVSSAR